MLVLLDEIIDNMGKLSRYKSNVSEYLDYGVACGKQDDWFCHTVHLSNREDEMVKRYRYSDLI